MLNEVMNMISVVEICYVAIFAIAVAVAVDTFIYHKEGGVD